MQRIFGGASRRMGTIVGLHDDTDYTMTPAAVDRDGDGEATRYT